MTSEDKAWAQTHITVTPEDDATIREISEDTTVSATSDTSLNLTPENIVFRRSLSGRQFVTALYIDIQNESEPVIKQDAENQTYLEGIPTVDISIEYKDESSQTMYMSSPCPPLKYYRDIMTSMNEGPMPALKRCNATATIISFDPEATEEFVVERLTREITDEDYEQFDLDLDEDEARNSDVTEVLHFVVTRALWINDPMRRTVIKTSDKQVQTDIAYNNRSRTIVIDRETQTGLTCEPKESHTKLLANYWETKSTILNYLEDCISKAIDARAAVDEIMDEIIDKCSERIRYPMKEQVIQTIATYKSHGEKEEDILRKLRIGIVVDPFEASIVVVPLMDELLYRVCDIVSNDAICVSKNVLCGLLHRVSIIIVKLSELQKEAQRTPIEQILAKRKEKIVELLSRRETETISTQTSIAAISEVKKIKKTQKLVCSVCRRPSMCQWCNDNVETEAASKSQIKILRTQDILLSYKPCYVVSKTPEKEKYVLQPPCPTVKKTKRPTSAPVRPSSVLSRESGDTVCVLLQNGKEVGQQESVNEWSYVTDEMIMKPCSMKESMSSSNQTMSTLLEQSICQNSTCPNGTLSSQAASVLQILKETFCDGDVCASSSLRTIMKENSIIDKASCNKATCCVCLSESTTDNDIHRQTKRGMDRKETFSKLRVSRTNTCCDDTYLNRKLDDDGFKIIPLCLSQKSSL